MDFMIASNQYRFPESRDEQIALILYGSVSEAAYRTKNETPPPFTDYAQFFSISYTDLVAYLIKHIEEFDSTLPTSSWDGMSVIKEHDNYIFRWHLRGEVTEARRIRTTEEAINMYLSQWLLPNQGLQSMIPT